MAAINSGADAVYLGLTSFSARSSAENFDLQSLKENISYAHALGVKVYVALNTLVKEEELQSFFENAISAWNCGADALILQDVFLGGYIKKNCPQVCLHLSTQAGVCNVLGAEFAKKHGFSRVILARETPLSEIEKISEIIETETFIQGALCTAFSGKCYLSSFAGGNSGNRGRCKQPCRKKYRFDRAGFEDLAYRLSLSDLCVGCDVEKLKAAGVSSFKIEGRMRRPEYVAAAVKYYKNIFAERLTERDFSDLKRAYNRGNYTKGLAFGQDKSFISSSVQGHIGEYCGSVVVESGKFICRSRADCVAGDCFKILRGGQEICGATCEKTLKGGFVLNSKTRLKNGDKVFLTTSQNTNARLCAERKKLTLNISVCLKENTFAEVCINGIKYYGQDKLQPSLTRAVTREDIEANFKKVGGYPFVIAFDNIETGNVFMPASQLNSLRRQVYKNYFESLNAEREKAILPPYIPRIMQKINKKTAVIAANLNGLKADIGILKLQDEKADINTLLSDFYGEKFLYIPPFASGARLEKYISAAKAVGGVYADGYYGIELAEKLNLPLFVGLGLNISNSVDIAYLNAKYIALSHELSSAEFKNIRAENTFVLAAGGIKVMDIIYCPFEKTCLKCDKRNFYKMTDEEGREFVLHRTDVDGCAFELYNCASLITPEKFGVIIDCTTEKNVNFILENLGGENLKKIFKSYTRGHYISPVI